MCSEGVSVWFACKLCKSFFLNADDFAYHKKKYHVQEFRNTKFIVFEEQTSPTTSPPENWVSFLSLKEERHIHKIISSPSPPPKTNFDYDSNSNPRNENTQSNRNIELVEIDLETHKVSIFNNHDDRGDTAADVTNNCFELNSALNSYSDVDILQNQLLQSRAQPPSVGCDFAGAKTRDKQCSTVNKSNSLKISKQNKKNPASSSNSNVLQTVIQSPHNPYVYLKRLNLITIQNESHHSNSAVHPQENNRNHVNTIAEPANEPKITNRDEEKFCGSNFTVISPPMKTTATAFGNCKFCSESFNSSVGLRVHEQICRLKKPSESIVCIPCHLTFGSSDELNGHNRTKHSTFIFSAAEETAKGHGTELADDLKVVLKKQSESDFLPSVSNNSRVTDFPLSTNHGDDDVFKTDCHPDLDLDPVSNDDDFNGVTDPITEVNLNFGELLEVAKTENVVNANEDSEFPGVSHDPFELESRDNALAEEMLILADNLVETQDSQTGFYSASCKIHFTHVQEIKEHNKNHHVTPDGKKIFKCPYPDCETISSKHCHVKTHLQHVHSNSRPFKCPHPGCNMSFKTLSNRRVHLKLHTMDVSRRNFECPYANCGKRTTSKWNLGNHIQQVHSNVRPYKCPHPNCTQSFKVLSSLNGHLKRHAKWSKTM